MPPQVAAGDRFRYTSVCQVQNQYTMNVWNLVCDATAGISISHAVLLDQLDQLLAPLYKASLTAGARYHGSRLQLVVPSLLVPISTTVRGGAGTLAGDQLPTQVAGVVSTQTALAGRSFRGRLYFPPCGESDNQLTGVPSAAYKTAIGNIASSMIGPLTIASGGDSADITWVVRSNRLNLETPVERVIIKDNWGTQRRRSSIGHADSPPF